MFSLHDFKHPDPIIRELNMVLKSNGVLAVIDHKFDRNRVVSTINHATNALILRDTGVGNGKSKEPLLIFLKKES